MQKAWDFAVDTWNVDRTSEVAQVLAERRVNLACVQETRWKGSGCRFFGSMVEKMRYSGAGYDEKTEDVGVLQLKLPTCHCNVV